MTGEQLVGVRDQLLVFARELNEVYREEKVRTRELEDALRQLRASYLGAIKTLALVVEAKDFGTRDHLDRTHDLGMELARMIDPVLAEREELSYGFLLHDIGKVGVPESVLSKRGPLAEEERKLMKAHPVIGAQIVAPMAFLGDAVDVIRYHHERFDGRGYPEGRTRTEIPLPSRIFSVVDAFDAMTSDRPYRRAITPQRALDEIIRCSGTQFDPEVVEAFLIMMRSKQQNFGDEQLLVASS